jgi:hypothetical protein
MPDAISLLVAASEGHCPQINSPESGFDSIKVVKAKFWLYVRTFSQSNQRIAAAQASGGEQSAAEAAQPLVHLHC